MQVTETLSDGLRRAYAVVIPAADLQGRRDAKLAEVGRTLRLPGFRPGRVPMNLVRQRFGGSVMAEVLQDSVNTATDQVISDRGLRPIGQPKVDLVGAIEPSAGAAADLEFKVEMEILPEIAAPDLSGLRLTRLRAEPGQAEMDRALAAIAARSRTLEPVGEGEAAQVRQVVVADFTGTIDGVAFAGGTGKAAEIEIGGEGYVPGFAEPLEGIRAGETRTITVIFPETYGSAEIAGKTAQFEVTALSVSRAIVPPIDDALAEKLGLDDLAALQEEVRTGLQREYDGLSRMRLKRALLDQLAERAAFPAPQGLVEAEFEAIWRRVQADLAAGQGDGEDAGKDETTLRGEYRAIADRRVRLGLLLAEIGRVAAVQVTPEEMQRALRAELARYPGMEMQYLEYFKKNPQAAETLRGPIFEDKVVDHILGQATVESEAVSPEALAAEPEEPPALAMSATEAGAPEPASPG